MDSLQAIFLGIIQGLTEFLPVSSSGHLVIFQKLIGLPEHDLAFDVAVHLGTLLTVIIYFFKLIRQIAIDVLKYPFCRKTTPAVRVFALMFVGSLPTAVIGFSFKDQFEAMFSNPQAVGYFLCITGLILYFTKSKSDQNFDLGDITQISKINFRQAFLIGIAQGAAIAPGISRSGTTIAAGIYLKIDRNIAASFSFMLALPAIIGASVLQLKDIGDLPSQTVQNLGVGALSAFLSGLIGLWAVLHFVKKGRLQFFSYYLWFVGLAVIIFF